MSDGESGYKVFWKEAVHQISEKISEQEFLMWFRNMDYLNSGDSNIFVAVPSSFYKDQVTQRYLPTLESTGNISPERIREQERTCEKKWQAIAKEKETPSPPAQTGVQLRSLCPRGQQ